MQTTAPFSAAASALIAQIEADARAQLLADLIATKDTIVLCAPGADKSVSAYGDEIDVSDSADCLINIHRRRIEPESWRNLSCMTGYWHPSRWHIRETRMDACGAHWVRNEQVMVCDDFGQLVGVAV